MGKKTKAKKKDAERVIETIATEATEPELTKEKGNEYVFISRDKSKEMKMSTPMEGNKASEVVFEVLKQGPIPEGLKLQWADSYMGHFVNRRGKNACGAFKTQGVLVINGIASELESMGVKGIIQPEAKPYKAIRVNGLTKDEIKDLVSKIALVLGFTYKKKKAPAVEEASAEA
jgi:hypothetical protein